MESTWRRIDNAAMVVCVSFQELFSCRVLQQDRVLHNSLALSFFFFRSRALRSMLTGEICSGARIII